MYDTDPGILPGHIIADLSRPVNASVVDQKDLQVHLCLMTDSTQAEIYGSIFKQE
jgi:hypothetical protein